MPSPLLRHVPRGLAAALALAFAGPALAQDADDEDDQSPAISRPVTQSLPVAEGMTLNAALGRLAQNPRDIAALIDAGKAALAMGDFDAAIGFYQRADQLSPGNPRVKAGLAGAYVRSENPFAAIPLFVEAERAGAGDATFAGDRGLAFDLVGDNATAQGYYKRAMALGGSDEIARRFALSQAIAGDRRGMEATLSPLLLKQDKAAWRARAFGLAILGLGDEAESIAYATMPKDLAAGMSPYLRYMPRLTPAQQAAAANFGHFPRASAIGSDDPRVAAYAKPLARPALAGADTALVPAGKPLGKAAKPRNDRGKKPATVARTEAAAPPPVPQPTRQETTATLRTAAPVSVAAAKPAPALVTPPLKPAPAVAQPVVLAAATPGRVFAVPPPAATPSPAPGFDLGRVSAAPAATAAVSAPGPAPRPKLTDLFADLGRPSAVVEVPAGAVDVRRITPLRPAAAEAAKPAAKAPAKPAHPSRIWVQVATGRDKAALGYDWRRLTREDAATFRGKQAWISAWGQTNRLLTGPFETQASANAFLAQLRRADVDGAFLWTSPAGQVVDALAVK